MQLSSRLPSTFRRLVTLTDGQHAAQACWGALLTGITGQQGHPVESCALRWPV